MPATDARNRYTGMLLDDLDTTAFPSPTMLDRCEATLRTRQDVEAYVEMLFAKVDQRYPSPQLLRRLSRSITVLEVDDEIKDALAADAEAQ